jgi:hypothetical protein
MTSPSTTQQPEPQDDPFDTLLTLESQYHAEGLALGQIEGAASGRIEGRVFGLEKSFEKFIELGRLGGRAAVWEARLPSNHRQQQQQQKLEVGKEESSAASMVLPGGGSERLVRHVKRLVELTDAEDVSRENSEEGVQDFDDRLREARAKGTLVERLVGEGKESASAVKRAGVKGNAVAKSSEMEDFGGLPGGVLKK